MDTKDIADKIILQLGLQDALWILLGLAVIQFMAFLWFKARLESSIKHSYDKLLKDYEAQVKIRDQAARVAELLALAFTPDTEPARFNQLAWELSLWLPAPLVCDLSRCLVGDKNSKTPKEILIEVRKILLQAPDDALRPENLVHREDPRGRPDLTAALIKDPIAKSLTK